MSLDPAEIRGKKLKRQIRGYSRAEVEQLLEEVAGRYEAAWRERVELGRRVEELEKELAPLREYGQHLSNSLVMAERAAAEVRAQAERDAEEILEQARARSRERESGAIEQSTRLKNEIERLELVKRELHASLRAVLLAGLELVDDRDPTEPSPVTELTPSAQKTPDHVTA